MCIIVSCTSETKYESIQHVTVTKGDWIQWNGNGGINGEMEFSVVFCGLAMVFGFFFHRVFK